MKQFKLQQLLFPLVFSFFISCQSSDKEKSVQETAAAKADPLAKASRENKNGWVYVHLEGSPADIGYQHGYLLAPEIADGVNTVRAVTTHNTKREWNFYRTTAQNVLWKHIDAEYQQELQGIVDGLRAHGVNGDLWD